MRPSRLFRSHGNVLVQRPHVPIRERRLSYVTGVQLLSELCVEVDRHTANLIVRNRTKESAAISTEKLGIGNERYGHRLRRCARILDLLYWRDRGRGRRANASGAMHQARRYSYSGFFARRSGDIRLERLSARSGNGAANRLGRVSPSGWAGELISCGILRRRFHMTN